MVRQLRKLVLGIPDGATRVSRRGFRVADGVVRDRIEQIGQMFAAGYHAALENDRLEALLPRLEAVAEECRGFAFEGAAMALALLDYLTPWRRDRIQGFLAGPGGAHTYMVHVAVGWAVARLPVSVQRARQRLDPLLGWLVLDGYGFHEGFFHWPRYLGGTRIPGRLKGYERRVFDQGLGRSLWFVDGADAGRIPQTIASFASERHSDLWSGVGLACGYAGGVDEVALRALGKAAGSFSPELAQGIAFAAKARRRAGHLPPHTELACALLCGTTARDAAQITDETLEGLPAGEAEPAYEIWRRRIQARLSHTGRLRG